MVVRPRRLDSDRSAEGRHDHAARALGFRDIGSLEPGKQADLVVIDGNPLDDIATLQHNVALVMKGGRIVRNELEGGPLDQEW